MRNALVAKKPARPTTSPMLNYRYFTTSEQGDATVARAADPYLQGTALAELVKLELAQIAQTSSKKSLIIDFQNVKVIGSSVISSLLGVKRQVVSHDKSLKLCGMSKSLRHVFKTLNMYGKLKPCNIFSVDVKKDWINDSRNFIKLKGISNVSFAVEDLTNINHQSKFDLIVCVDVMEHIQKDVIVFRNFYDSLKKGGYLLINSPSIFGGSDVHDETEEGFIGEHARDGYSKEDLEAKLHPIGFSTYKSRYTYGFWGDKAWRLGIKYPMLLLNISKLFLLILPLYYLLTFPFTLIMMSLDFTSESKTVSGINFIAKKE